MRRLREWARQHENGAWAVALALLTLGSLAWRLVLASRGPRLPDEETCTGMAEAILRSGAPWPLHGGDHPLLGIYLLVASAVLFGPSLLGYRMLGVVAGSLTPLFVALAVARSASRREALVAAALLAVNPLHAGLSAIAFEIPFQLLFGTLAWWCLAALPAGGRRSLLLASAFLGLAFLCSENAALLGLGWALVVVFKPEYRRRLTGGDLLAAGLVFLVVIGVDVFYNLTATRADYAYVNYLDHVDRIARPGLSLQGLGFFLRDVFNVTLADRPELWVDYRCEYPGPGAAAGTLLLLGAVHAFSAGGDPTHGFSSVPPLLFVLVTTFLGPAAPSGLDPPIWTWPLPSLPLVVASSATLVVRRWRRFWPVLVALILFAWFLPSQSLDICR